MVDTRRGKVSEREPKVAESIERRGRKYQRERERTSCEFVSHLQKTITNVEWFQESNPD